MAGRLSLYARALVRDAKRAVTALMATALMLAGVIGVVAHDATPVAAVTGSTVYNSIPATLDGNYTSLGFQATQTAEFGDKVTLASSGALGSATVLMSSWACQSGGGPTCVTTPGATFSHPLTFKVYAPGPGPTGVGALLLTKTQTFNIPYRPSASAGAPCNGAGPWYSVADNACYNGFATPVTFDLGFGTTPAAPVSLPSTVIWTVSFNTQTWGAVPVGSAGPWNSLNVGLEGVPTAGTDVDPDGVFWNTSTAGNYTDGGAAGVGVLRFDDNWTPYVPMARLTQLAQPTISIGNVMIKEGNAGSAIGNVPVSLDHSYPFGVTVKYATAVGGGFIASEKALAGQDYPNASGTLTIPAGATSASIPVAVTGDTKLENNEKFLVNLSNPTNATLSMAQSGIVTIGNDELPQVVVHSGANVAEGTNQSFAVTLKQSFWTALNLNAASVANTAASPGDYTAVNVVVTFPAADTSAKTVTVFVKKDGLQEPVESFYLQLTGGSAPASDISKIKANKT